MQLSASLTFQCPLCTVTMPKNLGMPEELISKPLLDLLQEQVPTWTHEDFLCFPCVEKLRTDYFQSVMETEQQELTAIRLKTRKGLREHMSRNRDVYAQFEDDPTFAEQVADAVARMGGSWAFIFSALGLFAIWIFLNSALLLNKPFDPYPYVFLNIVLSAIAVLQAPIILMSQNRESQLERKRAEYEHKVNLKAELEIRHLHTKMDQLLTNQWQRLLEIQAIQTDLMHQIIGQNAPQPIEELPVGDS